VPLESPFSVKDFFWKICTFSCLSPPLHLLCVDRHWNDSPFRYFYGTDPTPILPLPLFSNSRKSSFFFHHGTLLEPSSLWKYSSSQLNVLHGSVLQSVLSFRVLRCTDLYFFFPLFPLRKEKGMPFFFSPPAGLLLLFLSFSPWLTLTSPRASSLLSEDLPVVNFLREQGSAFPLQPKLSYPKVLPKVSFS